MISFYAEKCWCYRASEVRSMIMFALLVVSKATGYLALEKTRKEGKEYAENCKYLTRGDVSIMSGL